MKIEITTNDELRAFINAIPHNVRVDVIINGKTVSLEDDGSVPWMPLEVSVDGHLTSRHANSGSARRELSVQVCRAWSGMTPHQGRDIDAMNEREVIELGICDIRS